MHPTLAPTVASAPTVAESDVDRHVANSIVWQAGKVAVQIVQYIVLARLVLPAEYGKFALAAPLFTLLGVMHDGGLSTATVTGKVYDARLASNLYWTQLVLGAGVAIAMALLAPLLALIFGVPELRVIGFWLALCLFVGSWSLQPRASLRRAMRVGALAMVDIAGALAGLAVAWGVSFISSGVEVLLAALLGTAFTSAVVAFVLAPVRLYSFAITPAYRHAIGVGWRLLGSDLLNALRMQCPAFIIGFFALLSDVGFFNRANQLLNLPLMVLGPAMVNFLLPLLARSVEHPAQFRRSLRRTLRLFLAAAIPASVWIALGPTELIAWTLGAEWAPVVPILRYLSPMFAVQIVCTITILSLVSRERAHTVRLFSFWNLALTAGSVLLAAPLGVEAVAIALSISGLALRAPLLVYLAVRDGSISFADILEGVRFMLALAACAAALLWLCRLLPWTGVAGDLAGLLAVAAISGGVLMRAVGQARKEVFA